MNVKVIAEIGCNHKGDIEIAKRLILMQKNVVRHSKISEKK